MSEFTLRYYITWHDLGFGHTNNCLPLYKPAQTYLHWLIMHEKKIHIFAVTWSLIITSCMILNLTKAFEQYALCHMQQLACKLNCYMYIYKLSLLFTPNSHVYNCNGVGNKNITSYWSNHVIRPESNTLLIHITLLWCDFHLSREEVLLVFIQHWLIVSRQH